MLPLLLLRICSLQAWSSHFTASLARYSLSLSLTPSTLYHLGVYICIYGLPGQSGLRTLIEIYLLRAYSSSLLSYTHLTALYTYLGFGHCLSRALNIRTQYFSSAFLSYITYVWPVVWMTRPSYHPN